MLLDSFLYLEYLKLDHCYLLPISLPELFVSSHGGTMTMSLMHQWHDTICGGVIGPRRSLLKRMDASHVLCSVQGAYGCILVFINKKGFSSKNIDSVCSVGRSIKKGLRKPGYIREKGIGFKSGAYGCIIDDYHSLDDKLNYLEHPIHAAPIPAFAGHQVPPEALAAHTAWVKGQKEVAVLMLMTMEPDLQQNLENLGAYDML
ncbi:hypothetical protein Tco_0661357 [Tanacetum coccineum]